MSLCNQVLDFSDDTTKELLKEIMTAHTPPEMVKKAQVETPESRYKKSRADFALVIMTKEGSELRRYPVTDAANTWLSCRYFEKTAHKLPSRARGMAGGNLKLASNKFGLQLPDLAWEAVTGNVYHEAYDMTKTAAPIQFEELLKDDSKHFYACSGHYPMPDAGLVKTAAQYFADNEKRFTPEHRHEFAHNVLERAKELSVALENESLLKKYAGADYGDILGTQLKMRKELLEGTPNEAVLEKVATKKAELAPMDFAQLLHTFDKKASLDRHYGKYLADAYKSTFETRFTKTASTGYSFDSDDGSSVSEKELTKTFQDKYDKVKGYFGPTVANELKKHGCQIFDSLPKDAKEVIVKIAKGQI